MLKRLLNRLHIIMTGILMVLITLILAFSFWNTYQSSQTADITYIQRMTSLIIYQLEADTESPETVLSDYEEQMNVYAMLSNSEGSVLYKSASNFPTDFDVLLKKADQSIGIPKCCRVLRCKTGYGTGRLYRIRRTASRSLLCHPSHSQHAGRRQPFSYFCLSEKLCYGNIYESGASLSVYLDWLILHHCIHQPTSFEKSLCSK